MTTEQMLDLLSEIGTPRLCRQEEGTWFASVKFPAPKGVTAEVSSDFKNATHTAALQQVIERLRAIKNMGDGVDTALKRIG